VDVKLSQSEIQEIAAQVARILRCDSQPTPKGHPGTKNLAPQSAGRRGRKPRGGKALTPEQAVAEFPSLTVRTIRRAITEEGYSRDRTGTPR
jgi:hypothetical protein